MSHEHGENQKPEERDYRQEIAQHEAPVLAFDPLLDLALELGWRVRNAAPLFAPGIKFAVISHGLSPNASFGAFLIRVRRTATLFSVMPITSAISVCNKPSSASTTICRWVTGRDWIADISRTRWSVHAACSSGWGPGSTGWSDPSSSSSG
jgi:hypothetical protein